MVDTIFFLGPELISFYRCLIVFVEYKGYEI